MRICEDRSFEDYETLKHVSSFDELKKVFETADAKYDSGLFELLEEDAILVDDNVLIDIFMGLYYPNNSSWKNIRTTSHNYFGPTEISYLENRFCLC